MRHRWLWLWCHLVTVCLAARTSREPPKISVRDQGVLAGKEVSVTRAQRSTQYLGIPFAHVPTGDKRFAPPVTDPPVSWPGTRNGSIYGPACMQVREEFNRHDRLKLADRLFPAATNLEISEDCLYLNVYLPDGNPPSEGWPVVVWFHSGNFSVGASSLWDASVFAVKQKVVVVTSGYRLNVFGFLTTQDGFAPGNFGLLDQVAALDWVLDKIDIFGGSKDNVALAGHSAGAESVALHTLSPLSEGKFARAIAMSGSALTQGVIRNPQKDNYLKELASKFNCKIKPTSLLLECLRDVPEKDLLKEAIDLADWGPIIDAPFVNESTSAFLPGDPLELLMTGRNNKVDLLTGFTDMEKALTFSETFEDQDAFNQDTFESQIMEEMSLDAIFETISNSTIQCTVNYDLLFNSVIFFYSPALQNDDASIFRKKYLEFATEKYYVAGSFLHATYVSKTNAAFLYRFDYKLKTTGIVELEEWMNVPHMLELPFIWGMPYWTSFLTPIVWNNADRKQTDLVMSLWGNFSKFSNPASKGRNVQWEPFTAESPGVLIIDKNIEMSDISTFNYKAAKFWNDYYPKLADASYTCCNTTSIAEKIRPDQVNLLAVITIPIVVMYGYCDGYCLQMRPFSSPVPWT